MCENFIHRVPICWGEGIEVLTPVWLRCLFGRCHAACSDENRVLAGAVVHVA